MSTATKSRRVSDTFRILRTFKSASNPNVSHRVQERVSDNHVYCTCRGYSSHGACKHLRRFLDVETLDDVRNTLGTWK